MTTNQRPWQRTYPRIERPYLMALLTFGVVGTATATIGLAPVLELGLLMLPFAFLVVPRFARVVISGAIGGVLTGIFVLGVGMRIAMRIIVLMDPVREPVLTDETGFLLFFGGAVGLLAGLWIAIAQRLWSPRAWIVGAVFATFGILSFLAEPSLRTELFNEGAGESVNIPLFTVVFFLFGVSATVAIQRVEAELPHTPGRRIEVNRDVATV